MDGLIGRNVLQDLPQSQVSVGRRAALPTDLLQVDPHLDA
ncbi:hypothetical protein SynSYN20_01315 [Synechococcus sp. SYN20]|nr:hypothetical protein SynSYN20_01315 [Synechococcus sp. SYN20]